MDSYGACVQSGGAVAKNFRPFIELRVKCPGPGNFTGAMAAPVERLGQSLEAPVRKAFGVGLVDGSPCADNLCDEVGGSGGGSVSCDPYVARHIDNNSPAAASEAGSLLDSVGNASKRIGVGW